MRAQGGEPDLSADDAFAIMLLVDARDRDPVILPNDHVIGATGMDLGPVLRHIEVMCNMQTCAASGKGKVRDVLAIELARALANSTETHPCVQCPRNGG